jgi:CheY-like chemotaxis protein
MATRIIQFGVVPSGILAALTGSGYRVDACGISIPKVQKALQQQKDVDAIAVSEHEASQAAEILNAVRSLDKVPLILFQDHSRTCDPSEFDLAIGEDTPLSNVLKRIAELIETSRALRAQTEVLGERFHCLLRESRSLQQESAAAVVETRHIRSKRRHPVAERVRISSVLVVDDYSRWRETVCSMLSDYADCGVLCEAEDGIEAIQRATELKPQLILLDLDLPRMNGIEAARQIAHVTPDSAILFVSMNNTADIVREALSTGAKGYLLKADAGSDFWPAIEAVLQNQQYLSRSLRGLHSVTIN